MTSPVSTARGQRAAVAQTAPASEKTTRARAPATKARVAAPSKTPTEVGAKTVAKTATARKPRAKKAKPELVTALSVTQLVQIKQMLGFTDNKDLAEALGLSHISAKRLMTGAQGVSKQLAFLLVARVYFHQHPRAAAEFDDLLTEYNKALPRVSD